MTRKFRVEVLPSAGRDLRAIETRIARDNPTAAAKWVRQLRRKVAALGILPYRFEVIPEAPECGADYRHFLFGNYRIIYRVEAERVVVMRILHAARILDPRRLHLFPPE